LKRTVFQKLLARNEKQRYMVIVESAVAEEMSGMTHCILPCSLTKIHRPQCNRIHHICFCAYFWQMCSRRSRHLFRSVRQSMYHPSIKILLQRWTSYLGYSSLCNTTKSSTIMDRWTSAGSGKMENQPHMLPPPEKAKLCIAILR